MKVAQSANTILLRDPHVRPGLYLVELRSHHAEHTVLAKRKLVITVDTEHGPDSIPKVVKITHT
jgi:hypothetical protein